MDYYIYIILKKGGYKMKNYIKPIIECVDLRAEERLATCPLVEEGSCGPEELQRLRSISIS